MLRWKSPANRQAGQSELTLEFRLAAAPRDRRIGGAIAAAASVIAFAVTSGVSAESLAQPREDALERTAAAYIRYREDVAAIEAIPFNSAETTREAHRRLSAHNSKDLSAGWVAYAALVAADTPAFREALQKEVASKKKVNGLTGIDAFNAKLAQDPTYPRQLDGANEAIERVLAMTTHDAARFTALGESFKAQAYAMQKTSWGKSKIPASATRLSDADDFARRRGAALAPQIASVTEKGVTSPSLASANPAWKPDWGTGAGSGRPDDNAQATLSRVMNLAARYATSGVNAKSVAIYARNDKSDSCLSFAALTLKQCIAATRAPYEEAFCLGEHALNDTASCIGWVAGVE